MKTLSWVQVLLGVLILAAVGYVAFWSRTALIDKLEGPAFEGQTGAAQWVALHPAFLNFGRWFVWVVGVFGLGVVVLGVLQVVRYPKGNMSHPSAIQVAAGFLVAVGSLLVLLAVKPDQFILSLGAGAGSMAGMVDSMWDDPYAVITFITIILGLVTAGIGLWQHTLASRKPAVTVAKPGWKSARSAGRGR
jgi:hypothetical protein